LLEGEKFQKKNGEEIKIHYFVFDTFSFPKFMLFRR